MSLVIDLGDSFLRGREAVGTLAVCFGAAEELAHQDHDHEEDAGGEEDRGEGIAGLEAIYEAFEGDGAGIL